ncbi:MAG: DUF616 domain-containing protein [Burkholderiales bacterium]|nr:MAG: DUF616 domain-containing protein [Burkholderiales bacterium]
MLKIKVYSCAAGNYDRVAESLFKSKAKVEDNVSYTLFTDQPYTDSVWEVRPLQFTHPFCARRSARWHKINSDCLFPDYDATVWIDANFCIKDISITDFVQSLFNSDCHIFAFKHPDRTCIYQEYAACKRLNKDNPVLMLKQVDSYAKQGYPSFNGLVETGCVVRRNTPQVEIFNMRWWQELHNHSFRDQLSFNYVAWKLSIPYGLIPGRGTKSDFFDYIRHIK